ncbi:MAG: hypothetical protein WD512_04750, partial [Candidatus Paceibacterota bacterium]
KKILLVLAIATLAVSCKKEKAYEVVVESQAEITFVKIVVSGEGSKEHYYCEDFTGCDTKEVKFKLMAYDHEKIHVQSVYTTAPYEIKFFRKGKEVEPYEYKGGAYYKHK